MYKNIFNLARHIGCLASFCQLKGMPLSQTARSTTFYPLVLLESLEMCENTETILALAFI